ncbi:hypothetical protein [Kribbella lupini]|uniref:hypothetical protein n=1 Tax=Kribbella lupini TaxID=291602 RepID=UPI0031CFC4AA
MESWFYEPAAWLLMGAARVKWRTWPGGLAAQVIWPSTVTISARTSTVMVRLWIGA